MQNKSLEIEINRVWNTAVYLQMMAAFCKELDFSDYKILMMDLYEIIKRNDEKEIDTVLPKYDDRLNEIAIPLIKKYPLKRSIDEIATDWNLLFKNDKEVFSNGVMIGWLGQQINLKSYYFYDYYPYHFKVGLVIHKSRGEIEEHFLLKDAFSCLIKAQNSLRLLEEYGQTKKDEFTKKDLLQFDKETLNIINIIKYDVSLYSRLTIVSFFSFIESFINSIGFDHYYRNQGALKSSDIEILQGKKRGRHLSLKNKIEKFQKIIREDNIAKIVLSDTAQIKEPFKTLFETYEELRNSSVHFSPQKTRIWLKPHDWVNKAQEFSNFTVSAALEIWKSCHETSKGPDYLGRLDYNRLYKLANENECKIDKIEKSF
ncbi:MAG: hypothetical protein R2785_08930 [Flavobacteriaceae bacterium]